ncbi:MAG: DUF3822 family protein [Flavobacteriaceae bacterium]|nr:DUF3822 family protein [Flavobacteriaceae bacterium]MDG1965604.1 DUF3822 family protein [Flavobacteriaceae bacterium]
MLLNKKTIQDKELSIQIFKGGFSFCTHNARPFFSFEAHSIEQGDAFQKLLDSHSFLENEKIKGIHFNHTATFVPKKLYSSKQKKTYLNYNVSFEEGWSIGENQTQDDQIKILYPVNSQIESTLKHYFKNISFTHYSQILYDLSVAKNNTIDPVVMNIHLQDDQLDLLVYRNDELLLFNTYPYKNEQVFLYFVMAIAEELSLSPEAFNIVFFGKYNRYKKCYTALENYHSKIIFADQGEFDMFDEKDHPAPYFLNLFD